MSAIVQNVFLYLYEVLNVILSQCFLTQSFQGHWPFVLDPYSTMHRPADNNPVIEPPRMCACSRSFSKWTIRLLQGVTVQEISLVTC